MPLNDDRYSRLWLKPFSPTNPRVKFMKKIGSGSSGYVFKVRINGVIYALKMASETPLQMCNLLIIALTSQSVQVLLPRALSIPSPRSGS